MNKVVARFTDGRVVKGSTVDFTAGRDVFHVVEPDAPGDWHRTKIAVRDLKALFYVKDLAGDPTHVDSPMLDCDPAPGEKAVGVTFRDGEVIVGTTPRYRVAGRGFFLVPADAASNNTRCYVPQTAARDIVTIC